jgi:hypothetical protein
MNLEWIDDFDIRVAAAYNLGDLPSIVLPK